MVVNWPRVCSLMSRSTSPDGVLARLAAPEAGPHWNGPVSVLAGGTAAWTAAGFTLEPGATRMLDDTDDVYYLPYDHGERVEQAMRDYLTWEINLVNDMAEDDDQRFNVVTG